MCELITSVVIAIDHVVYVSLCSSRCHDIRRPCQLHLLIMTRSESHLKLHHSFISDAADSWLHIAIDKVSSGQCDTAQSWPLNFLSFALRAGCASSVARITTGYQLGGQSGGTAILRNTKPCPAHQHPLKTIGAGAGLTKPTTACQSAAGAASPPSCRRPINPMEPKVEERHDCSTFK